MAYIGGSLKKMTASVGRATTKAGRMMAEDCGDAYKSNIKKNTPVETTKLRESYRKTPVKYNKVSWSGKVFTTVKYAAPMEYGSGLWGPKHKKFKITPKKVGGVLAFNPYVRVNSNGKPEIVLGQDGGPVKGGKVFTTFVLHPGSPGHAMFRLGAAITEFEMDKWAAPSLRAWKSMAEKGM